jgi:hypothetical protein
MNITFLVKHEISPKFYITVKLGINLQLKK